MTNRRHLALIFALFGVLAVAVWVRFFRNDGRQAARPNPRFLTNALETLNAFERQEAEKFWGSELLAEEYGRVVDKLWDSLNASTNKLSLLVSVDLGEVSIAAYSTQTNLPFGIHLFAPGTVQRGMRGREWRDFLERATAEGWQLAQCEFRHTGFTPAAGKKPAASRYYFSAHLFNTSREERAILEGDLSLTWEAGAGTPRIRAADATNLRGRTRHDPAAFRKTLEEEVAPPPGSYFIDPLIVWDLDGDGRSEIILAAKNQVYRRDPAGNWSHAPLCREDPGLIFTGALGDFTGNGTIDFLCAKFDGLFLYEGTPEGQFPGSARQVWAAKPRLKYAQAMALGDIDHDGDLDVFLGQYKVPYDKGQMPRPYFDANDGHPSFLLENDGSGHFTDITQKAGLGAKRARRVYNAALIDLNGDSHLDLLVISDFAGLDAYQNDGAGHYTDVTGKWFDETHAFGMANCFADFNRDGWLDVMMIGMNSPTVDRLASLGLRRPYEGGDDGMRSRVTAGNRLYFGAPGGTWHQSPVSDTVARTGWSWGCAAEDFDNDGYPDLYIVNGHETHASVRDYEPEFWLHDIFVGESRENALAHLYFSEKFSRTRGRGHSYGGYEKNRFFLNVGGTNFLECAYLMGLALEQDSRNVAAEDLDGDGRLDLIITTFEVHPKVRQTVQVFRNELPVMNRLSEIVIAGQKRLGNIFHTSSNYAQPAILAGSYRSQSQPRLRVDQNALPAILESLRFETNEFRVLSPRN